MKLKSKMIVLLLITFAILLVVPSMVNATVLDNSTITVSTSKYSSDGSISLSLSGLTLDLTHSYQYSLVKNMSDTPTKWIDLVSPTETTANCVLSATTAEIKEILKVADTGYLFIKDLNVVEDDTDDTNIVEKLSINLKLPFTEAIDIQYSPNDGNGKVSFNRLYSIGKASYQAVEITDQNIIDTYLSNSRQVSSIVSMLPTSAPINGWNEMTLYGSSPYAYAFNSTIKNNDGLYLIWAQMYGDGCRTIYGYTIYDNLPEVIEAPTMENLRIEFSNSFVYDDSTGYQYVSPGTTITIKATFSEIIYGNTAPTLKIKCGNGEEITVPAGTITGKYILYNYTIKEQDKGIIAAVSMTGGDVADEEGNTVESYTCPTLYTNWMSALATNKLVFANGSGVATEPDDDIDGDWTDFSKAKFELKKDGTSGAILEITGVTPKEGSDYYLFITSNSNKPNVTSDDENLLYLRYNKESKKFTILGIAKYIELNQDIYITILEKQSYKSEKIVLSGKKLDRFAEPKYSDAFFATFMTKNTDQIVTTFTHDSNNNRKIQIKIGKISDTSILQKIKNQDVSGFASLLAFAKSNKGMYDKLLDATKNNYAISYDAGAGTNTGYSVIDLQGLQNEEYYFLYIKTYDEDGKYVSNEAVTLAQANVFDDHWALFFYGNEDFEWADFGNVKDDAGKDDAGKEDDTKAPIKLPDTGKFTIMSILAVATIAGVTSFIKTRKYKGI